MYSWDDKEAECFRLYVEENKSLDEVIAIFHERGFTPSKRAFQVQFKRWDFPSKYNPGHKNPALVARLRELWEQNYSQKDMVDTLQTEGFSINEREVVRLRLRLKLLLRESREKVSRPKKASSTNAGVKKKKAPKTKVPKALSGGGWVNQLGNSILAASSSSDEETEVDEDHAHDRAEAEIETAQAGQEDVSETEDAAISTEEAIRKQLRQEQRQAESDEKWRTRKRRRRTRGWAGLPADAPGEPPRFPSETTIDEAKAYLGLDNKMYRETRERFFTICKQEGIIKKTIAGPEKWAAVVRRLIREDPHLVATFQLEQDVFHSHDAIFRPKTQKALSMDVICMDVTKRLRTMESRMTLAEAKNILQLNPEQARIARNSFAAKLKAEHITSKFEAGEQQWADLKTSWVNDSPLLARVFSQGEADPEYDQKLKALQCLARDVLKREQHENKSKDPSKKQVHQGPGPGPAPPVFNPLPAARRTRTVLPSGEAPPIASSQVDHNNLIALAESADMQIDPSLLLAARSNAAILPDSNFGQPMHYHSQNQYQQQVDTSINTGYYQATSNTPSALNDATSSQTMPLPIYFRLHPHSTTPFPSKNMWLSILQQISIAEIKSLAVREHPGTQVMKLDGIVSYKLADLSREVTVDVGSDEELLAYFDHVRNASGTDPGQRLGKATFVVLLGLSSAGGFV